MAYTEVTTIQLAEWFPVKDFDSFIGAWMSDGANGWHCEGPLNRYLIHLDDCGPVNQVGINLINSEKGFWGRGERCTCAKDGVASFLVQELMITDPGLHYVGARELFGAIHTFEQKKYLGVQFAGHYTTLLSFQVYRARKEADGVQQVEPGTPG